MSVCSLRREGCLCSSPNASMPAPGASHKLYRSLECEEENRGREPQFNFVRRASDVPHRTTAAAVASFAWLFFIVFCRFECSHEMHDVDTNPLLLYCRAVTPRAQQWTKIFIPFGLTGVPWRTQTGAPKCLNARPAYDGGERKNAIQCGIILTGVGTEISCGDTDCFPCPGPRRAVLG